MYKYNLELTTMKDIHEFVNISEKENGKVILKDGTGFCVNGKSMIGAIATLEWDNLYCESENDIYMSINKFCK